MLLTELFRIHNVECPDWLSHEMIEDDLINAYYTLEDNMHKWELNNPIKHLVILFDGETLNKIGYDKNGEIIFTSTITKEIKTVS